MIAVTVVVMVVTIAIVTDCGIGRSIGNESGDNDINSARSSSTSDGSGSGDDSVNGSSSVNGRGVLTVVVEEVVAVVLILALFNL